MGPHLRVVINTGPSPSPLAAHKGTTVFTLMGQVSTLTSQVSTLTAEIAETTFRSRFRFRLLKYPLLRLSKDRLVL